MQMLSETSETIRRGEIATISFTASTDHERVDRYEARLYRRHESQVLDILDLGRPAVRSFSWQQFSASVYLEGISTIWGHSIYVGIEEWLKSKPLGQYEVRVAAINRFGEGVSTPSNEFTLVN